MFEFVFSSKGVGEPPLTLATAVVCAIRGAVASYRRDQGERIRMACQDDVVNFVTDHVATPNDRVLLSFFE